jgi:general secretion pathway protein G
MEMVVVLVILSLLAAIAAPYARRSIQREKELQLRETLRTVRTAIDRFHADWEKSQSGKNAGSSFAAAPEAAAKVKFPASAFGYPLALQTLVDGVERPDKKGEFRRYLRALPVNPFAPRDAALDKQWRFESSAPPASGLLTSSYGQTLAEAGRKENDIYDLHPITPATALDGSRYADW